MTVSATLLELAERCERIVWSQHDGGYPQRLGEEINEALGIASYITDDGNPVLSLDAAMTLVPEGWHVEKFHSGDPTRNHSQNLPRVTVDPDLANDDGWAARGGSRCETAAATPALALTAAALKARALATQGDLR